MIEVELPDGTVAEFPDGTSPETIKSSLAKYRTNSATPKPDTSLRNPDGTYGQPPEGFALNPRTGQMEDLRSPNNPNIPTGRGTALALGAGQGLGFGSLDEVVAGGRSMMGGGYDYELGRMREAERRASEEHPGFYYGGLIPGAVASSVSAGKALGINPQGANLVGTSARGAGIGAGEGAIWGALSGEGGAANRGREAVANALMGGMVGAAAPSVIGSMAWGGRKAADLAGGGVDAMLGRASQGRANRSVMDMMRKAGVSVDQAADDVGRAAQQGQPEFRLMDAAGIAGQRKASGIVRSGGDGAEEVAQFLRQRQIDQPNRAASFIEDAFAMKGKTAASEAEILNAARKATNDVNYAAARKAAGPVNLNAAISTIDDLMKRDPILGENALSKSEIGNRLAGIRGKLQKGGSQLIDFDSVLNVKEDLGGVIGALKKSGKEVPKSLSDVFGALDDALATASDAYRAANTAAREGRQVIRAVDQGAEMARPGARAADTVPLFQGLTPEQQAAARIGYGDKALTRVEANASPTSNAVRQFNSTKMATEADAMAIDPALFKSRVGRENTMWETQNRALGGSRTADNLSDVADMSVMADMGRATRDALTGRIGNAIGTVARHAGNAASGQNEATRTLIARILLSSDPKKALAGALRQEATSEGRKRIAEAMTRALGREFIPTP